LIDLRTRVEFLDLMRGLAVCGFIVWHAFDMFYGGNKYDEPVFRAVILTRVSFVMISASVLGLKNWGGQAGRIPWRRGLKLAFFPVLIGLIKSVWQQDILPIIDIIWYLFNGTGDFTFSILVALGIIHCFLPLVLKYHSLSKLAIGLAVGLTLLDFFQIISIPPFWTLMIVALLFARSSKSLVRFLTKKDIGISQVLLFVLAVGGYVAVIVSSNAYWMVRNHVLLQIVALFLGIVSVSIVYNMQFIKFLFKIFENFGKNSLFVYLGHYCIYAVIVLIIGGGRLSVGEVVAFALGIVLLFHWIFERLMWLPLYVNKKFLQ